MTPEQEALRDLMPVIEMIENAHMALHDRDEKLFTRAVLDALARYQQIRPTSPVLTLYRQWLTTHGPHRDDT